MTERHYNEAEVAAIIQRATEEVEAAQRRLPSTEGMTLAQLEEIGREVGLAPEAIRRAAQSIDRGGRPMARTFLGFPLGVGRTVDLDRRLSDDEWERLVVDLREIFDARGTVKREGSLRQWTNGNLQALLEPTPNGQRLRLRTIKGEAQSMLAGGLGIFGVGVLALLAAAVSGLASDPGRLLASGVLVASGGAMFAAAALRLPKWARLRQRQMEEIATRLTLAPSAEAPND